MKLSPEAPEEVAETGLNKESEEAEPIESEKIESKSVNKKLPRGSFNKMSSSISIKNFTEEKKENKEDAKGVDSAEQENHGEQDFTEEEFLSCWGELAKEVEKSGKEGSSMVISAMITRKPLLKDDYSIEMQVDNLSQLEEVKQRRTDLHEYLRKNLKNSNIELKLNVLKDKKQKKAYTQEEKFKKMAEKNPYLLELKKKLDLDFF